MLISVFMTQRGQLFQEGHWIPIVRSRKDAIQMHRSTLNLKPYGIHVLDTLKLLSVCAKYSIRQINARMSQGNKSSRGKRVQ